MKTTIIAGLIGTAVVLAVIQFTLLAIAVSVPASIMLLDRE